VRALLLAGVVIFALGASLDIALHLGLLSGPYVDEDGRLAHWITLVGMSLTLTGVIAAAPRPRRGHHHSRSESHAHR
jgi:hypothetical protein